jgi:predicted nucleotidyltransferase component of viral defense system
MKPEKINSRSISVKDRLLAIARERREEFQMVLTRYAINRFLYRLSQSVHHKSFILKGATLFVHWTGDLHRTTRDVDLLGFGDPSIAHLTKVFVGLCNIVEEEDGLLFLPETVIGTAIKEDDEYEGVRITLLAMLGKARIPLQIDIGFGDVITPSPEEAELPALLNMPSVRMLAYPRETVVAEKCEAIVHLGIANSRLKDFYDLWYLATHFDFDGSLLARAITATFERRGTGIPSETPTGLTPSYYATPSRGSQWTSFVRKSNLASGQIPSMQEVMELLQSFLLPILTAISGNLSFAQNWDHDERSWQPSI